MFEKIYLTILIIQIVLLAIDLLFELHDSIFTKIVEYSGCCQIVFFFGYWIVKLIGLIWGFNF